MRAYYSPPQHLPGIGVSKHQVIIIAPFTEYVKQPEIVYVSKRKQGPKERGALCNAIRGVDWSPLYYMPTCQDQYDMFQTVIDQLIDDFLPIVTVKRNSNDHPWVTDDFRKAINLRQYYFHSGNTIMFNIYGKLSTKWEMQSREISQEVYGYLLLFFCFICVFRYNLPSLKFFWKNIDYFIQNSLKNYPKKAYFSMLLYV